MKKLLNIILVATFLFQLSVTTVFASETTIKDSEYVKINDPMLKRELAHLMGKNEHDGIKISDFNILTKNVDMMHMIRVFDGEKISVDDNWNDFFYKFEYNHSFSYLFEKAVKINGENVEDLNGIEHIKGIDLLVISGDSLIKDLSPITKIEGLKYLVIEGSQIEDLSPLEKMKELKMVSIKNSNIKDVSSLSYLPNLIEVELSNNQIEDITPLTELENLQSLILKSNNISKIPSDMKRLKKLNYLELSRNNIEGSLEFINDLESLTYLNLYDNQISDISALNGNNQLLYINISGVTADSNPIENDNWNTVANDYQLYRTKYFNFEEEQEFQAEYIMCGADESVGCGGSKISGSIQDEILDEERSDFEKLTKLPLLNLEVSPNIIENYSEKVSEALINYKNRVSDEKYELFIDSLPEQAKEAFGEDLEFGKNLQELEAEEKLYLKETNQYDKESVKEIVEEKQIPKKEGSKWWIYLIPLALILPVVFLMKNKLGNIKGIKDQIKNKVENTRNSDKDKEMFDFDENDFNFEENEEDESISDEKEDKIEDEDTKDELSDDDLFGSDFADFDDL